MSTFLIDHHGFERNPYDYCVANKIINEKQATVVWYVDDLKISHVDEQVVSMILEKISDEFGSTKNMKITTTRGKVHNYLGMCMDYLQKAKLSHQCVII